MAMRLLFVLALLLSVGLAGCTGEPPPGTDGDDTTAPAAGGDASAAQRAAAGAYQEWTLSDYWVYDMEVRGFERFTDAKLAYYEERGPEFMVGTPSYDEALYHAIFSYNPIMGRVHKDHLSPHERGVHAEMYPFDRAGGVIRDGLTWSTTFYERGLDLTATYLPEIQTPMGPRPGFHIEGIDRYGEFHITYDYVPEVKWFTEMRVVDEDGQRFHLKLKETGTGYSGEAHFIRAKDLLHETIMSDGGFLRKSVEFDVTADHVAKHRVESFGISADIQMASGISATLRLIGPDGATVWERSHSESQSGESNIEEVWPNGGKSTAPVGERPQWPAGTYTMQFDFNGEATADVHVVGTQDNSGSV